MATKRMIQRISEIVGSLKTLTNFYPNQKKEGEDLNVLRNEKRGITTNTSEIQKIIWE
jgi:hypothetical protein